MNNDKTFKIIYEIHYKSQEEGESQKNIILNQFESFIENINSSIRDKDNSVLENITIHEKPPKNEIENNINIISNVPEEIGLPLFEVSSYISVIFLYLCNIQKLVYYFRNNPKSLFINDQKTFSFLFKEIINILCSEYQNKEKKSTTSIKNLIENFIKKNKFFSEHIDSTKDAKMFLVYLISKLHSELNQSEIDYCSINNYFPSPKFLIFNKFISKLRSQNNSIINELFFGINYNEIFCYNCQYEFYSYQNYFYLLFDFEQIIPFKKKRTFGKDIDKITIKDCFEYYTQTTTNQTFCHCIQTITNCNIRCKLYTGPPILILIFIGKKDLNTKFKYKEYLNLSNYIEDYMTGVNYKLDGVITRADDVFIGFFNNPITNKWNKFKGNSITPIENLQKEVIDSQIPYILFYKKIFK